MLFHLVLTQLCKATIIIPILQKKKKKKKLMFPFIAKINNSAQLQQPSKEQNETVLGTRPLFPSHMLLIIYTVYWAL